MKFRPVTFPILERDALDAHGQPDPQLNMQRRIDRGVYELLGMVRGVLADGVLVDAEVHALEHWLQANPELAGVWPVNVLSARLARIFEDGRIDAEEREDLAGLLEQMIGGGQDASYGIHGGQAVATSLPLDEPPPSVVFTGNIVVFTGKFAYGTRKACEQAVMARGASCASSITRQTNLLVIGTFGSRDWIQSPYGRKIEKAAKYRDDGLPLAIVSEELWAAALG
jgi:hypothetical protein